MKKIKVALIGCGRIASNHFSAMEKHADRVELTDVCDIDSTALNLHSFYSGLERLLEYAAYQMEGSVPKGRDWRKELLRQMSSELPGLRPAMLQPETVATLDEFRRFRHVVRNVYAEHLDPSWVGGLVVRLTAVWHQTHTQLLTFAEFLEGVSRADDLL